MKNRRFLTKSRKEKNNNKKIQRCRSASSLSSRWKRSLLYSFQDMKPHVSKVTALFLLSQVFLIITHVPLVRLLAWIIFHGDANIFTERGAARIMEFSSTTSSSATSRKKAQTAAQSLMPTTMVRNHSGSKLS